MIDDMVTAARSRLQVGIEANARWSQLQMRDGFDQTWRSMESRLDLAVRELARARNRSRSVMDGWGEFPRVTYDWRGARFIDEWRRDWIYEVDPMRKWRYAG